MGDGGGAVGFFYYYVFTFGAEGYFDGVIELFGAGEDFFSCFGFVEDFFHFINSFRVL